MESMLRDPKLAAQGSRKIAFAWERMPVLRLVTEQLALERPLEGERVAACLHVTTETANLCRALMAGGAEVAVAASNPLSTKDDVAAAMAVELGACVYAVHGCDRQTYYQQVEGALSIHPTLIVDDGADLTGTIHRAHTELLPDILAGSEVTSTGVLRLRNMQEEGALRYPVLAVNDAQTKHFFDNRYGTGQSTIDGILRATNTLIAGSVFVVVGYGWCGRGVATRARGMGARVVVCEVDPVKALEAVMEGYQVLPIAEAAELGDIFVAVTGNRVAIGLAELERMKSGAIVCNSGHFDVEIDVQGLRGLAVEASEPRENVVEYLLPSGAKIVVLAEGRLVGQSCAEAHPAAVMDLSFATQALAVEYLSREHTLLEPGVHDVPASIDERVARLKLTALGVRHDELSERQLAYLGSWTTGT